MTGAAGVDEAAVGLAGSGAVGLVELHPVRMSSAASVGISFRDTGETPVIMILAAF